MDSVMVPSSEKLFVDIENEKDLLCYGDTGEIIALPALGIEPYTYLWNDPGETSDSNLSIVVADEFYLVEVRDADDHIGYDSITLAQPPQLTGGITDTVPISYFGYNDGKAMATISGGTPSYKFEWDHLAGMNTPFVQDLLPDVWYYISITDTNNCTLRDSLKLAESNRLDLNLEIIKHHCQDIEPNGILEVESLNGIPPFTYQWNNDPTLIDPICNEGQPNIYNKVYVSDFIGNLGIDSVLISEFVPPVVNMDIINPISCNGDSDGSVQAIVNGSAPPFTYLWDDDSHTTINTIQGLSPSRYYHLSVADTNQCSTTDSIMLTEPEPLLSAITDSQNVSCYGYADGTATVTPTGGTPPYNYQWNDQYTSADSTVIGLAPDQTYQVNITDANGCTTQTNVNLSQPDELQIQGVVEDVTCYGLSNGSVVVSASGGTLPYYYHWYNPSFPGNDTLLDLGPGLDTLEVVDANGCSEIIILEVSEPDSLYLKLVSTPVCFNDSSGIINSEVTGGTPPYNYLWNNSLTTPGLSEVKKGIYTLTVSDANDCEIIATDSIIEYQKIITGPIAGNTNVISAGLYLYSVNEKPASVFTWTVIGGNLVSGQGTNFINVQWGPAGTGAISVIENDEHGCNGDIVSLDIIIGSTGIGDISDDKMRIYPNPVSDRAIIEYPNPDREKYKLIITDLTGKLVRYQDNLFTDKIEISLGDLSSGLYIIELRGPKIHKGKLVIEETQTFR